MNLRFLFSALSILCAGGLLTSCETTQTGGDPPGTPNLAWSVSSRPMDDLSDFNDVSLQVNGKSHLVDRDVISLKGSEGSGNVSSFDLSRLKAVSGYAFEWHVSGVTYFARLEGGAVAVYAEEWGDENEGASSTRLVKSIRY